MNWLRVILDGIAMSAAFNLGIAVFWSCRPSSFTGMFPKELQELAPPMNNGDKKHLTVMYLTVYLPVLLYGVISAWNGEIDGFWNLFLASFIQAFLINLGDFFGLDILFREKMGTRLQLPGTEGHELYTRKMWLKKLAIKEHWVWWPLGFCPAIALISAGLGLLLRTIF